MVRQTLCALVAGAAMTLVAGVEQASGQEYYPGWWHPWRQTTAPIFSNYYVAPPTTGGVPAQLYISPLPVPAHVGHTYVTNQVFMPHEMLYKHHRKYYTWHDRGGNYTTTCVRWW